MFEAFDPDRDLNPDHLASLPSARARKNPHVTRPSEAVMTVLETGFRARVMSWQSAYDLGARSNLSLAALKARTDQCARFIHAGLGCAVDETLFAALVYHYPHLARDLTKLDRN